MSAEPSKLALQSERVAVAAAEAVEIIGEILMRVGCGADAAREVAEHLADASLCGVESHGLMRALQYVEQFQNGYMNPAAGPRIAVTARGTTEIDVSL